MLGYLFADIICSEKRTVFRERSSRKIVSYQEQIMSKGKYPSIFSRQMATIVYIFPNFQNCARCEKDLKDNKDNSLHLGRKYARIFVLGHYLFLVAHSFPRTSLSENCSLLETDNVRWQISEHILGPNGDYCLHIFAPNGDYCLFMPTFDLIWKLMRQMSNSLWEAKFGRQKNGWEKDKLVELSTKELQEITDNAVPVTTKRS